MNKFYQMSFLMVLFMHISGVFAIETDVTINVRLAPGAVTDALQEAVGSVANEAGNLAENTTQSFIEGIFKGTRNASESGEFGETARVIFKEGFRQGAKGFADGVSDQGVRENIKRGAKEWTTTVGQGFEGFEEGVRTEIAPNIERLVRDITSTFWNFRNAIQYGSITALGVALPLAGVYGSRVLWNVIEKRLLNPKPEIVVKQANPVFGRWDRMRRRWRGYKTPPMIFDQSVKDRLPQIKEKTKTIRTLIYQGKKMTYDNLLLYGKPGTGKTLFAQILADETDMDFLPVTAASLLQSGVEGIKYFNELLELANRSTYGVIIFIDEADALFVDRNNLSPDSDHYKVLNHILAITGSGSNKFMIVAATNHAYVMDEAMGRRFQDRVHMPLPDATTRLALLDLYCAGTLLNNKENSAEFVAKAKALLTPALINKIAAKTAGLSHAEIKDMVSTMNKASQITTVTAKIIHDTVEQAIEKHRVLEEEKTQREERFAAKKEQSAIPVA